MNKIRTLAPRCLLYNASRREGSGQVPVQVLEGRGIDFRSVQESIDTTPGGKLVFHVFGALAEFELGRPPRDGVRRLIQESEVMPMSSLRLRAPASTLDESTAVAMARQVRREVDQACQTRRVGELHLFCAVPQGLLMLIGRHFGATLPVQLYE